MKKIILIVCILLCSGCKDYVEINDLALMSGMIINYKDNMYEITSQLIINDEKSYTKVFTTKAITIEEALLELSKLSNKEIFLAHLKVLIITDEVIKNNVDYYNYFLRDAKSKMNFNVYIVDEEISKELLNIYENSDGSSLYIDKMMSFNDKIFSSSTPLTFIDLMYKKLEPGYDLIYPSLTIKENNNNKSIYLENLVFFNKKNKIILDDNEAIHYNILSNNVIKTNIDIPCGDKIFSLTLNEVSTKYKWDKKLTINTNITGKITSYNCDYDLEDNKTTDLLISLAKKNISKELYKIIDISKNNDSDILGIVNYIYKHDKNNKLKLRDIETKINLKVSINSTGEIRK